MVMNKHDRHTGSDCRLQETAEQWLQLHCGRGGDALRTKALLQQMAPVTHSRLLTALQLQSNMGLMVYLCRQDGTKARKDTRVKKQNARNRNPKRKHVAPLSQQFHTPNVTCMNQEAFLFPYSFRIFLSSLVYMYFFSLLSTSFTDTRIFSLLVPLLILLIQVIGTPVTGMSFLAGLHKKKKINK
jgi:hypothetical protein